MGEGNSQIANLSIVSEEVEEESQGSLLVEGGNLLVDEGNLLVDEGNLLVDEGNHGESREESQVFTILLPVIESYINND